MKVWRDWAAVTMVCNFWYAGFAFFDPLPTWIGYYIIMGLTNVLLLLTATLRHRSQKKLRDYVACSPWGMN